MLVTLIQWLKTHYQLAVLQERQLTEEQLQPLADMAKALMGLFANQHLLEKDEIPFVIEGLLIIAECYVAQCYNRLSTEQQLKFLIKEVQPTLTILAEKKLLTLVQQQDFEARIATFQADVLAHQQGNWRNGSAIEEVLPYAQKLVQLEGYMQGLVSPHTQAERKLNQLEANFLFDKASFYVGQRLAGSSLSATERLDFENAAEQLGQLLQLAHLKAKALCWYSQLLAIAINQQWPNWRTFLNRFMQVTAEQMPQATALWRHYQQLLTQYRHTLEQQLVVQPAPALAQFNTQLIQFTQQLWQESEQLLGPSPVKYCILALGSMSQQMLSAYSDVEYAILTETAEAADWEEQGKVVGTAAHYIKTLCEVFEFKVVSIGESNTGYKLDPNSQPRTEPSLRGTPDQLVEHCLALEIESHDGLVYSLLHATPLQGDYTLFETFHTRLQQAITQPCTKADHGYLALTKNVPLTWHQYWALAQFKRNKKEYDKYCVDKKETPDLKKPYLKLLRFMVLDLALYLNLPAQDFTQACEQLVAGGYLPADMIATIQQHVDYLLIERSKLHLVRGKEDDSALPEHQVRFEQIQQTLLTPYFETIHLLAEQGYALWQQAFWLACVPHHLSRQRTPAALTLLEAGFDQEKLYLPPELLQKVFAANGQIKATTPERNSAVFEWGTYCLKIQLPDEPKLEKQEQALQVFIAREYVVNQLSRTLGWLVTPAGCAIKLRYEIGPGQTVIYYGWLSQRLVGRDLENAKRQHPALLRSISPENYTALFLLSLLIYPEDGQPRNFMIVNNTLHQPAKLYSLDNKRVFIDPIEVVTSGFFRKTQIEQLKLKTCLYFLPQFQAELSKKIWQQCQQLDLAKVRENLLSTIQAFDRIVIQTLTAKKSSGQLVEHEFRGLLIPPYVLYSFLFKLEQLLARIPNVNHLPTAADCLKQCEPEIYNLYEKHLVSTVDYFQTFKANYRSNQFGQNFSKATLDFIQDNKIKAKALGQQLLKLYPKFAMSINWKDLPAEQQYHLLQLLQGQSLFELDLSDCVMLKNETLEELLKSSPKLTGLNLSNCPHLTPVIFTWLSRYCKQLETLIMNDNFWVKNIAWKANLLKLETLSLKGCTSLQFVTVTSAHTLKYVYLNETMVSLHEAKPYKEAFLERGFKYFVNAKYKLAVDDYDEVIRLDNENYTNYIYRGSSKWALGLYEEARRDYNHAISLNSQAIEQVISHLFWIYIHCFESKKLSSDIFKMSSQIYFFGTGYEVGDWFYRLINGHYVRTVLIPREFAIKNHNHHKYILWVSNTSSERFYSLHREKIKNVNTVVLFFNIGSDIVNEIQHAKRLAKLAKEVNSFVKLVLVGLVDSNASEVFNFNITNGQDLANEIGAEKYFESDPKTGANVNEIFEYAASIAEVLLLNVLSPDLINFKNIVNNDYFFSKQIKINTNEFDLALKCYEEIIKFAPDLLNNKLFSPLSSYKDRINKVSSKNSNIVTNFFENKKSDSVLALPQRYSIQINDQPATFEVKSVEGDGDCGYTAFGITRIEAYRLLISNLNNIGHIIKPAIQEALRTQAFIDTLRNHDHLTESLSQAYADYIQASYVGGEMSQSVLNALNCAGEDVTILHAYIDYDVKAKQIDSGWAHPCILFALAEIRGIELHIWQRNDQDELIAHPYYPQYTSLHAAERTDLLFVNGNHFERLDLIENTQLAIEELNTNSFKC